jgi:hypothetical protein
VVSVGLAPKRHLAARWRLENERHPCVPWCPHPKVGATVEKLRSDRIAARTNHVLERCSACATSALKTFRESGGARACVTARSGETPTPWYSRVMRSSLLPILVSVVVAACGGKQKSTTPPPPLPEPEAKEAKPAEPEKPAEPPAPPVPQGPIEVNMPAPKVEVKLVSAGKGKKAALKLTPKAGAKQTTELLLDFKGGQDGPPETGGKKDEVAPTVVLLADVETKDVAADGLANFQMTVSGVDTKDKAGQKVSSADFKAELGSLIGATIAGSVGANGNAGELKLRIEKPDAKSAGALEFVKLSLLPMWPVLPTEPVAPGAKWTVTSTQKIADQLEVTKVVTYELVGKKGTAWTIKGSTKVSGVDQNVQGAKLGAIKGTGTSEVTVNDGALVASLKQSVATEFTITVTPPPEAPAGSKAVEIKFNVEQSNALTPKT